MHCVEALHGPPCAGTFFTALKLRGDAWAWKPTTTVMWKLQILFNSQTVAVYKQEESVRVDLWGVARQI